MTKPNAEEQVKQIHISGMFQYFLLFHSDTKDNNNQYIFPKYSHEMVEVKNVGKKIGSEINSKTPKRVTFSEKNDIRTIYTWQYAYTQARKDKWQKAARDRVRFEKKNSRYEFINITDPKEKN